MYTLSSKPDLHDHISGSLDAPVVLVEYGDYECPHSMKAFSWVNKLKAEFGSELCYIYRHFPLGQIHPHSELAAAASEAAGLKNKFWEMHELLFTRQEMLSIKLIKRMAGILNLNEDELLYNMGQVELDITSGEDSGVTSTPAFFFNGMRLEGPVSYMILRENIIKSLAGQILSA